MASTNLSFRTPEVLMGKIRSRDLKGVDNPGATAKRDIERYYSLMDEGMRTVRLTPKEAVVLIYHVSTYEGYATAQQIADAWEVFQDYQLGLDENFDDATESLGQAYAEWPLVGRWAAWDAAERYQVLATRSGDPELTFGMALHRAGLHTYDLSQEELAHIERMGAVEGDLLPGVFLRALQEDA